MVCSPSCADRAVTTHFTDSVHRLVVARTQGGWRVRSNIKLDFSNMVGGMNPPESAVGKFGVIWNWWILKREISIAVEIGPRAGTTARRSWINCRSRIAGILKVIPKIPAIPNRSVHNLALR